MFHESWLTAVRAAELTGLLTVIANSKDQQDTFDVINTRIARKLKKLMRDADNQPDRSLGLCPLIVDIHSHLPNHAFCPSDISLEKLKELCGIRPDLNALGKYRLALGLMRSMKRALIDVRHRIKRV